MAGGMIEVAKATVTIIPNMQGAQATIAKEMGAAADSAGKSSGTALGGKLKAALAAAGIGAAIVKTVKSAVTEGAKLEQSLGGVETLFGPDAAEIVKKNASEAFRTAGVSANEYMEQATSFAAALVKSTGGDTKKAAEVADTALRDMSDNANKMGTSMESIQQAYQGFAKGQYQLLDNLKLGYGGTKTEMERLLADASKLSGQEYDIDNLNDVYEAIHVIQEDLGITGTTAKEASTTFAGSFGQMKAAATDFLGQLAMGGDVEGALGNLVSSAGTFLIKNAIPMIGKVVLNLGQIIVKNIPKLFTFASKGLTTLADYIGSEDMSTAGSGLVLKIGSAIIKYIPKLLSAAVKLVASLGRFLLSAAGQLVAVAGKLASRFASSLISRVKAGLSGIGSAVASKFNGIVSAVSGIPGRIVNMFRGLGKRIGAAIGKILPKITWETLTVAGAKTPLKVPHVTFGAKGGTLTGPTYLGNGVIGGEAGREALLPLDRNTEWADIIASKIDSGIVINIYGAVGQPVKELADEVERILVAREQRRKRAWL